MTLASFEVFETMVYQKKKRKKPGHIIFSVAFHCLAIPFAVDDNSFSAKVIQAN